MKLVVNQTDADIWKREQDKRLAQEAKLLEIRCTRRNCKHKWLLSIWETIEDSRCPRCKH
jgi:hypothetical protein